MSDIFNGGASILDPEILEDYSNSKLKPLADKLYGEDFGGSIPGQRVAVMVGKGAIKLYFSAECTEDEVSEEDGENAKWVSRTIFLHIGYMAMDGVKARLIASLAEDDSEDNLDEIDDGYSNVDAWQYIKLEFDYDTGVLIGANRYYALDTIEDVELTREIIKLDTKELEVDESPDDVVTESEYTLITAADFLLPNFA